MCTFYDNVIAYMPPPTLYRGYRLVVTPDPTLPPPQVFIYTCLMSYFLFGVFGVVSSSFFWFFFFCFK